jgi:hypothetical protein
MSTLLYAALTDRRKAARPGTSDRPEIADMEAPAAGKPGVSMWADAAAALVPAEVLAAQAVLIGFVTEQRDDPSLSPDPVTVITDHAQAKALFWILLATAFLLYVLANVKNWRGADWLRMLIPPAAFFLWSLLQPGAAFQAVADWSTFARYTVGVVGAILLAPFARALAYRADQAT